MVCADTSFLFSLYGKDAHTTRALSYLQRSGRPLTVTALNAFEFGNAIRLAAFRKVITEADSQASLAAFAADVAAGNLLTPRCNLSAALRRATHLSTLHTLRGGYRGFDILHVAAALELGAKEFLTFDARRSALARAAQITVNP